MKTIYAMSIASLAIAACLAGCGDGDDRKPTKADNAAADQKRQAFIDNLNVPESQKAQMRARMGGPAAPDQAAAAKAKGDATDRGRR